jgi:hypothetical protein
MRIDRGSVARALGCASGVLALAMACASAGALAQQAAPATPTAPAATTQPPAAPAPVEKPTGLAAVQNLEGRWRGKGYIEVSGGAREEIQCIATYVLREKGNGIEQNLRCASTSYKVDAQAKLRVSGDSVSGNWEEKQYAATGSVLGKVKLGGFNLLIKGDTFSARMSVASGKGTQTLNIVPTGLSVTKITVGLTKT